MGRLSLKRIGRMSLGTSAILWLNRAVLATRHFIIRTLRPLLLSRMSSIRAIQKQQQFRKVRARVASGHSGNAWTYDPRVFNQFPSVSFNRKLTRQTRSIERKQLDLLERITALSTELDRQVLSGSTSDLEKACEDNLNENAMYLISGNHSEEIHRDSSPLLSIVVPVFNNGRFLLGKCLPSVLSNQFFSQFEVLLVDDHSSDHLTRTILTYLERLPNFRVIRLQGAPSGSASRPRNIGIECSRGEYVTFLDPDNEISSGGYDRLLLLAQDNRKSEFVTGYQKKIQTATTETGRHVLYGSLVLDEPRKALFSGKRFPVVSTQACVIKRCILADSNIRFVEEAVGQDTLFGWQIVLAANSPIVTSRAHLIYYAGRNDSVTNSIDVKYFLRAEKREKAQAAFLRRVGLLDDYRAYHLSFYFRHWYLVKLRKVPLDEVGEVKKVLARIAELYEM